MTHRRWGDLAAANTGEAERRLTEYGRNELPTEPPPSVRAVARGQLANPMNIMLLMVVGASFVIVQIATALVVLGLVAFNVVMGTSGELRRPGGEAAGPVTAV